MLHKKVVLAAAIAATFGTAGSAYAARVASDWTYTPETFNTSLPGSAGFYGCTTSFPCGTSNFTMLTPKNPKTGANGYAFGGTNDVPFIWDGTWFDSSSDYTGLTSTSNATLGSNSAFFANYWTAHHVQIFKPGTYTFDSALANGGTNTESGIITMTVGAGQIGAHMLFNWSTHQSIDVINVWNVNSTFLQPPSSSCASPVSAPSAANCLWSGPTNTGGNGASTVFALASTDNDGDGTLGVPMKAGGPFPFYNANFNLKGTIVPVPAAAWLLGSGLLGLVGIARRKKKQTA